MWWIVAAIVLVIFWSVMLIWMAPAANMIIHAYAISYEKKHRIFAKVLGRGIDVAFYLSVIYVIAVIGYCVHLYFK